MDCPLKVLVNGKEALHIRNQQERDAAASNGMPLSSSADKISFLYFGPDGWSEVVADSAGSSEIRRETTADEEISFRALQTRVGNIRKIQLLIDNRDLPDAKISCGQFELDYPAGKYGRREIPEPKKKENAAVRILGKDVGVAWREGADHAHFAVFLDISGKRKYGWGTIVYGPVGSENFRKGAGGTIPPGFVHLLSEGITYFLDPAPQSIQSTSFPVEQTVLYEITKDQSK